MASDRNTGGAPSSIPHEGVVNEGADLNDEAHPPAGTSRATEEGSLPPPTTGEPPGDGGELAGGIPDEPPPLYEELSNTRPPPPLYTPKDDHPWPAAASPGLLRGGSWSHFPTQPYSHPVGFLTPPRYTADPNDPSAAIPCVVDQPSLYSGPPGAYGHVVVIGAGEPMVIPTPLADPPNDYMSCALFVTVCCCWIVGLSAIQRSRECREAAAMGDRELANRKSREARVRIGYAICLGVVCLVIVITVIGIRYGLMFQQS